MAIRIEKIRRRMVLPSTSDDVIHSENEEYLQHSVRGRDKSEEEEKGEGVDGETMA